MTSAVRDAENGAGRPAGRGALGFPARILTGDEEARLTPPARHRAWTTRTALVIDIGGGSTELVLGRAGEVTPPSDSGRRRRHSERHLQPTQRPRAAGRAARGSPRDEKLPRPEGADVAIAVAGSPTQCAAIDLSWTRDTPSGSMARAHLQSKTGGRLLARFAA